jgi:copper transport protein
MVGDRRRRVRGLVTALVGMLLLLVLPATASAHTDFEGSTPTDGAEVTEPLDRVVLTFTNPATPSGDGLELLDASGEVVPTTVEDGGTEFALVPRTPLEPGEYGVRWEVRAGDAHPIDGSFTFVVTPAADVSPSSSTTVAAPPPSSLDEALDEQGMDWAEPVRAASRLLVTAGAMLALGGLAALLTTIRGSGGDLRAVLAWVRAAGAAVALGGLLRLGVLVATGLPLSELWGTPLAVASLMRVVGGLALLLGLSAGVAQRGGRRSRHASAEGAGSQWLVSARSVVGLVGAGLVLLSFWFDGHTVSQGPWVLHAAVNAVHVGAAAVWSGGVLVLTALVWRRRRRGEPQDGAWLVGRFSRIAGSALAAVVLAGAALALIVLDSPAELWGSSWGRVLLAKTAVVGVAAALGGVVHLRLRPALAAEPDDPGLGHRVQRSFTAEAVAFVVVIVLTSWLVAATT